MSDDFTRWAVEASRYGPLHALADQRLADGKRRVIIVPLLTGDLDSREYVRRMVPDATWPDDPDSGGS